MQKSTEALLRDDFNSDHPKLKWFLSPTSELHNAGVWTFLKMTLDYLAEQGYLNDALTRMNYTEE